MVKQTKAKATEKPVKRRKRRAKKPATARAAAAPSPALESAEQRPSLLDEFLGTDNRESSNPTTPTAPQSSAASRGESETSSTSNSEPLSAEAERILSGVADHIGAEPGEAADGGLSESETSEIAGLMDCVEFSPEDVAAVVAQFCEQMDVWFNSDHWKITEAQQRLIGKPYAQLANSMWGRVKVLLPGWLQAACDATPGLMGSLMVTVLVFAPKATKQFALSRQRASAKRTIRPNNAVPVEAAPAPFDENSPVVLRKPAGKETQP